MHRFGSFSLQRYGKVAEKLLRINGLTIFPVWHLDAHIEGVDFCFAEGFRTPLGPLRVSQVQEKTAMKRIFLIALLCDGTAVGRRSPASSVDFTNSGGILSGVLTG